MRTIVTNDLARVSSFEEQTSFLDRCRLDCFYIRSSVSLCCQENTVPVVSTKSSIEGIACDEA